MRTPVCLLVAALGLLLVSGAALSAEPGSSGAPWRRHTIDDSARGADGVRLADANGDALLDIATGWEEAGLVRVYLNPGIAKARDRWPAVTVGKVKSPEDAVLVDLDGDGAVDAVSCCEGQTRSVFVHWAPREKERYLDPAAWETAPFPALQNRMAAMYCLPLDVDGNRRIDLVIGGKGKGAQIGWLEAPPQPRDLAAWRWHPLCDAGWTMSLVAADVNGDGDTDVLASDRKGAAAGCLWLENPGPGTMQIEPWKRHALDSERREVMFLHHADWDGDRRADVLVPTYRRELVLHRRTNATVPGWETTLLPWPAGVGLGKGARIADVDLNGRRDLVLSFENYEGTSGLVWLESSDAEKTDWTVHDISGQARPKGLKMDDVQLLDVDGDGDQDAITTEERTGWGVVWFENPAR